MATKTYKQIAKHIEDNGFIRGRENEWGSGRGRKRSTQVQVDGQWHDVSAASWNKVFKQYKTAPGSLDDFKELHDGRNTIHSIEYTFEA